MYYPQPIAKLIDSFTKLPGIGPKTAARLAFFTLKMREDDVLDLAKGLVDVKRNLTYCEECFNLSQSAKCYVCTDETRDQSLLVVVQESTDVVAIEKMKEYNGLYHVLQGAISPMDGIGPDDIKLAELLKRLTNNTEIEEVIIATNPNIEGTMTAEYISRLIKPSGIKITRIAHGLPVGGDLEYADEVTLSKALEGRREI